MRVLAVTHGPDVRPEVFADVIAEDGHELVEWDIRSRGAPVSSGFDAVKSDRVPRSPTASANPVAD